MDRTEKQPAGKRFGRRALFARMAATIAAGAGLGQLVPQAIRSLVRADTNTPNVVIHPSAVSRSNKESSTHGS